MKKDLFDKLYITNIGCILKDVDSKYLEKVKSGYKRYIVDNYSWVDDEKDDFNNLMTFCLDCERNMWQHASLNSRLSSFVEDKALDELKLISGDGYSFARQYLEEGASPITIDDATKKIKEIEKLAENVEYFNKPLAEKELSEAILDYNYAAGINKNIMSLRLGRESQMISGRKK